ncbi:MAG TPA: hypothetical protein VF524_04460 [Polyangia bacterium]
MRGPIRGCGRSALLALGGLLVASCGPLVEKAPFAVRPDTLQPGDLLGPFDGIIVDAETERPIASATVSGSWAFERGIGLRGPAGMREFNLETSADGRYQIPRPDDLVTGGSMRLRRFTLIVYRRGYVAYRSDFKFGSDEVRHDFSQHANKIRLEKWQPTMEHRRHLAFLGGGQAIAKAAGWEAQPASLEYEGLSAPHIAEPQSESAVVASAQILDVSPLLSVEEVRGVTGFAGELEVGRLTDRVRSDVYDSRHFKAKGKPEAFDVGVRVWALGSAAAEAQFGKLTTDLPAAVATEEIGDRSLRARGGDVLGLAFLLREKGLVIQISCGTSQCTELGMVLRLAKLVESHVGELRSAAEGSVPKDASVKTPTETEGKP